MAALGIRQAVLGPSSRVPASGGRVGKENFKSFRRYRRSKFRSVQTFAAFVKLTEAVIN